MQPSKRTALAVAGVAAIAFAVPALAKPTPPAEPSTCGGNTDVALSISQNMLWPPNHKSVPITITASDTDNDNDTVSVMIGQITNSDENANGIDGNGTGQPDTTPFEDETGSMQTQSFNDSGSTTFNIALTAERSGHDNGSGRTYSIPVSCMESPTMGTTGTEMENGSTTLTVFVPHDQGNNVNG